MRPLRRTSGDGTAFISSGLIVDHWLFQAPSRTRRHSGPLSGGGIRDLAITAALLRQRGQGLLRTARGSMGGPSSRLYSSHICCHSHIYTVLRLECVGRDTNLPATSCAARNGAIISLRSRTTCTLFYTAQETFMARLGALLKLAPRAFCYSTTFSTRYNLGILRKILQTRALLGGISRFRHCDVRPSYRPSSAAKETKCTSTLHCTEQVVDELMSDLTCSRKKLSALPHLLR